MLPLPLDGIISTSENFRDYLPKIQEEMKETHCIAFEMESAGPAQVCYQQKVPFIVIKAISDDGNFDMFNALKKTAAKNAELLVASMIEKLPPCIK